METQTCKPEQTTAMKSLKGQYLLNLLIAIDQLGNAIAAGYHDTTVSARVGFFSRVKYLKMPVRNSYWRLLRVVIDWAFYPVDGKDHCWEAYKEDRNELIVHGSDAALAGLGVIVLICAPIIGLLIRLVKLPKWLFEGLVKIVFK